MEALTAKMIACSVRSLGDTQILIKLEKRVLPSLLPSPNNVIRFPNYIKIDEKRLTRTSIRGHSLLQWSASQRVSEIPWHVDLGLWPPEPCEISISSVMATH